MVLVAFLLLARLSAEVEGVGKGKGRCVHRLVHVLQPLVRLQSKNQVHRG